VDNSSALDEPGVSLAVATPHCEHVAEELPDVLLEMLPDVLPDVLRDVLPDELQLVESFL